jgi:fatty acid desaturase
VRVQHPQTIDLPNCDNARSICLRVDKGNGTGKSRTYGPRAILPLGMHNNESRRQQMATAVPVPPAPRGEEFRDDARRRLPAAVLAPLTELSGWRSTLAVAQTFAMLAVVVSGAIAFWSVPAAIVAVVLIAPLQHALFVLAHDAAHYRLYRTRWLNDLVGRVCGTLGGIPMCAYRVIHRLHHNHLYGPQDPDIALHGGYPRGKAYLLKRLAKDLCGLTAWKTYAYFFGAPAINTQTNAAQRPLDDTSGVLRDAARRDRWVVLGCHLAMPIGAISAGWGTYYLVLWIVPLATGLQAILRLRAICEHGALSDYSSPLTAARTHLPSPWQRFLLFPHHVNYHIEHHLYPAVPHYYLPKLHAALEQHQMLAGAEVTRLPATLPRIFASPSGVTS